MSEPTIRAVAVGDFLDDDTGDHVPCIQVKDPNSLRAVRPYEDYELAQPGLIDALRWEAGREAY